MPPRNALAYQLALFSSFSSWFSKDHLELQDMEKVVTISPLTTSRSSPKANHQEAEGEDIL
jgi:hypothetical protein